MDIQAASPIPLVPADSSQIHAYGYDPSTNTLAVEFKSNADRITYHYKAVPAELAAALEQAESKGSFIYKNVKDKFDYDRLLKQAPLDPLAEEG